MSFLTASVLKVVYQRLCTGMKPGFCFISGLIDLEESGWLPRSIAGFMDHQITSIEQNEEREEEEPIRIFMVGYHGEGERNVLERAAKKTIIISKYRTARIWGSISRVCTSPCWRLRDEGLPLSYKLSQVRASIERRNIS